MTGGRTRGQRRGRRDDRGSAIVEFVGMALVLLLPLIYLVATAAAVQRSVFAVTQAAREAGRAMATAPDLDSGTARAAYAVRLALTDQGLPPDASTAYVPVGTPCGRSGGAAQTLTPGADFAVCVQRRFQLPGVPSVLSGRGLTVTGRYVVHIDRFRAVPR